MVSSFCEKEEKEGTTYSGAIHDEIQKPLDKYTRVPEKTCGTGTEDVVILSKAPRPKTLSVREKNFRIKCFQNLWDTFLVQAPLGDFARRMRTNWSGPFPLELSVDG